MYKKLINPEEHEVDNLLSQGFSLHSVTASINNSARSDKFNTILIYHFIKEVYEDPNNHKIDFSYPLKDNYPLS